MENEYMKRGHLLPEGCKDLTDVPKYKAKPASTPPAPLPPIIGEMKVAEQMTVVELAAVLKQKPFKIIADLMELGVFANVHQQVAFETITQVLRKYGYTATKAI